MLQAARGDRAAPPTTGLRAGRLRYFPVAFFSVVMGIAGLSLAWRRAALSFGVSPVPADLLLVLGGAAFAVVVTGYGLKWLRHPRAAIDELRHPMRAPFAATLTIALLSLATAGQDLMPVAASVAWWVGAIGHLAVTVTVLATWLNRSDLTLAHVTPAWFIPVVGNLVTPLAGPSVGSEALSWFSFSVGLVFWLALLPLVLGRLFVHDMPIPPKLRPTVAILVAPPSVGYLSYVSLTGNTDDPVAYGLISVALMFLLLVLTQAPGLARLGFTLSAWALSFPLAAAAAALVVAAGSAGVLLGTMLAWVILGSVTVLIGRLAARTVRAVARTAVCVAD